MTKKVEWVEGANLGPITAKAQRLFHLGFGWEKMLSICFFFHSNQYIWEIQHYSGEWKLFWRESKDEGTANKHYFQISKEGIEKSGHLVLYLNHKVEYLRLRILKPRSSFQAKFLLLHILGRPKCCVPAIHKRDPNWIAYSDFCLSWS